MKYVKIKSGTYNEAMMKLRMEYGDDAIPVSHKNIKEGGFMKSRFFPKNSVELTAAIPEKRGVIKQKPYKKPGVDYTIDDKPYKTGSDPANILSQIPQSRKEDSFRSLSHSIPVNDLGNNRDNKDESIDGIKKTPYHEKTNDYRNNTSEYKRFEKEFNEIKETLHSLLEAGGIKSAGAANIKSEEDELILPYINILKSNDFDSNDRKFLIDQVKNQISPEDLKDKFKIEKTLKDLLKSKIVTCGPIKRGLKKKVIMFIGPTGVGKTTTMAKLGALYALREDYSVSFITIDTYRIAATEQLKKYAGIMKIPIHVVNDQEEFKDVLSREKSEIIMVDTSGRSHKNDLKISEIKSYADLVEYDIEKILCVSANIRKSDLNDIFKAFGKINFTSVIVTKVDETSHIGSVIDIADKYNKPISYLTNGQEVPNDIAIAEPEKIADMIIGGVNINIGGL